MRKLLTLSLLLLSMAIKAQVGINILIPDSSAVLQLESTKKGLGLTRLTTTQMNAVWKPLKGLTIFNTTDSLIEYWNGVCWLKTYEKNCYECAFKLTIDDPTDTLDRTYDDSVFSTIAVLQTHGQQNIDVTYSVIPPAGVQVYLQGTNPIDSVGKLKVIVKADVFADGGVLPILITAICGDQIHYITYNVYVKPCVKVLIPNDTKNYDLQAANSLVLPAGARECILLTVYTNVEVTSSLPTDPSFTTGNLNPLSILGVNNSGYFLGRGGDGGSLSGNIVGGTPGSNGGNAMNLTTRTIINNYGGIYGGGGGGASIGLSTGFTILGINFNLGFGLGGGGGSELGAGGSVPSGGISLGAYYPGDTATPGKNSIAGAGGVFNTPITISYSGASITITPNGNGGNGGAYGQPGTMGNLGVCIGVGILGFNFNLGCFSGSVFAAGGLPGLAIKRNNNPLQNIADGPYQNNQLKGVVAP